MPDTRHNVEVRVIESEEGTLSVSVSLPSTLTPLEGLGVLYLAATSLREGHFDILDTKAAMYSKEGQ